MGGEPVQASGERVRKKNQSFEGAPKQLESDPAFLDDRDRYRGEDIVRRKGEQCGSGFRFRTNPEGVLRARSFEPASRFRRDSH